MYDARYDDERIRSDRFDFVSLMRKYLREDALLLDLGCGTCRKTEKMAGMVRAVWATDRSAEMIRKASENLAAGQISNVTLVMTDNHNTPFPARFFDICTACLTSWSAAEACRVLKPGGLFLIETLCPEDKQEIKRLFPDDRIGKRGYLSNQDTRERMLYLTTELGAFFEILDTQTVTSETTLPLEGLLTLLELTPTIRGFDRESDSGRLASLVKNDTVTFTERRIYIAAKAKPPRAQGDPSGRTV